MPSGLRVPSRLLARFPLAQPEDDQDGEKAGDDGGSDGTDGDESDGGDGDGDGDSDGGDATRRAKTCNDCNRSFCIKYNLPKCKTLPEEDVYTQCFRKCAMQRSGIERR